MPRRGRSTVKFIVMCGALVCAATVALSPPASAMSYGNYDVHIPDRRDFHTWVWSAGGPCYGPDGNPRSGCIHVITIPQPVAKAANIHAEALLSNGQYTMIIDDPFGLRCGDVYYGPVIPTHDVYTWDATTLAGEMVSSFDVGCDGAAGGAFTYPFWVTRM